MEKSYLASTPDENGYFGKYGGAFIPPPLEKPFKENPKDSILINLSGRGDKDIDFVVENHPIPPKP